MRSKENAGGRRRLLGSLLLLASLALLLVAFALAGPALADEASPEGCCVCDCSHTATTFGRPQISPGGICIDASSTVCGQLCDLEGCHTDFFVALECAAVEGCAQAGERHMAPVASPFLLGIIALALAAVGVYAMQRRPEPSDAG
jgi:hypothetical protein